MTCRAGYEEDAEHVMFVCPRFIRERYAVEEAFGEPPTTGNLVTNMVACQENAML